MATVRKFRCLLVQAGDFTEGSWVGNGNTPCFAVFCSAELGIWASQQRASPCVPSASPLPADSARAQGQGANVVRQLAALGSPRRTPAACPEHVALLSPCSDSVG